MYSTGNTITSLLISLGVIIVVFLIFRAVMLWYWKVNDIVKNQERTNELLEKVYLQLGGKKSTLNVPKEDIDRTQSMIDSLRKDQVLVKNLRTGDLKTELKSTWLSDEKLGYNKDFEMVYDPEKPEK